VNPSTEPTQVYGSAIPITQMMIVVVMRALLARLSKNGILAVLMMWIIKVCVRRDSTNHPVWNSEGLLQAVKTYNIMP
jgi:hypothetical protein